MSIPAKDVINDSVILTGFTVDTMLDFPSSQELANEITDLKVGSRAYFRIHNKTNVNLSFLPDEGIIGDLPCYTIPANETYEYTYTVYSVEPLFIMIHQECPAVPAPGAMAF